MEDEQPLLGPSLPASDDRGHLPPLSYRLEVVRLARNTLPITLSFALQQLVQAWSIIIVGRLGTLELGVASYGYTFASCTGSLIAIGGATALDTLCSQALASSKTAGDSRIVGIYLQRGLLLLSLQFLITIVPLWWFSAALFTSLGQEPEFARLTGLFLRVLIPGGLCQIYAECLKRFLQMQNLSDAVGWMIVAASVVGVISNYLLVLVAGMGVLGASCSHVIYHLSTAVLLTICAWRSETARKAWGGFSMEAFSDCWEFLKLAVSGILTVATEFWGFETVALMAARLNETSIGAQSIIMSSDQILACVPLGLGVATAHRIGSLLGAGDSKGARFVSRIPYLVALLVGLTEGGLIMLTRHVYGYIFSDSHAVVSMTAGVLPLIAVFQCSDISNGGAAGILRGAGKTHLAGLSNILAYYGVGITSAYYMCFRLDMGLFGLWAGIIAGSLTLLLLQTLWVSLINWHGESQKISARLSRT
ncbi:MATE efflux family protein [Phlyctema vagabunda]|uniref:MATE efflux family protein n=1 Tax=Phlyctema vagabunda TaxID=108571 RepID=A0ABR4PK81_9HELO